MKPKNALALGLMVTALVPVTGCGSDDNKKTTDADTSSSTTMKSDGAAGNHSMHGGSGMPGMSMAKLGSATSGDVSVELAVGKPTTFYIGQKENRVKHAPSSKDNVHMMAIVSDAKTKDRIPDASATATITDSSGKVIHSGPFYLMTGMGVGVHYGDNIRLPGAGSYTAKVVVGPSTIGRHDDVAKNWNKTEKLTVRFKWAPAKKS